MTPLPLPLPLLQEDPNGTDGTCDTSIKPDGTDDGPCVLGGRAEPTENELLDTVGAICVDGTGRVVSAVSSGGIVLKQPGRLGQVKKSLKRR